MSSTDLFSLSGKTAVVIGGGGVLAGAIAAGFAEAGADLAILDLNGANAEARAASIRALGRRAISVEVNATSKQDLSRALDRILKELGSAGILLNAAGINSSTPFFDITEDEWQRILDVNLKSMVLACQVFGKAMMDAGRGGSIINISSASSGPPLSKVFTYSITKGGVNQLTQFLARDFAPYKIRVNALAPGFIPAEQNRRILTEERVASIMAHTPMGRFGEPSEMIGACVWLAAERASSFVTGAIIRVDGGFTAMTI
jgi:NAD(P)-dependent dehydrogenase (short-subunit alcohol dehydrogenase family)